MEYFLGAEDVRAFPVQLVAHDTAATCPYVAAKAVAVVAIADVISPYGELLGQGGEGGQGEEEEGKEGGLQN